ncbi:MAG: ABC transporter ATP-binding protein [Cytophagales bacterium]|nr:ABC transporter ATP-binding protein [Cytophagales bacterium]
MKTPKEGRLKPLAHLNKYLSQYKYHLLWGALFVATSNFFSVYSATLARGAFDQIQTVLGQKAGLGGEIGEGFYVLIARYGGFILGCALLRGVFLFFMRQTIIVMSRHVEYDLKNEIYVHYQRLPVAFYKMNNTGDLLARISEDLSRVRMYLGPCLMYGTNMITLFALVIPYMFSISPRLAFFVLLPLPLLSISIYYVNGWIDKRSEKIQRQLSSLSTFVQEIFSGIRVVKASGRENHFEQSFLQKSQQYRQHVLRLIRVSALFFPFMLLLIGLSVLLAVYVGSLEVIAGRLKVGNIAEFIIYAHMLTWPVTSLGWVFSTMQRAATSQRRINEFLEVAPLQNTGVLPRKNNTLRGDIRFQHVCFKYPNTEKNVLQDISFDLPSKKSIAILGAIGAGKTTLANLIGCFYTAQHGQILIDQEDISKYDIHRLRNHVGYAPQDGFLFSDSFRNNLLFGNPQATEKDMQKVLEEVGLIDYVQGLQEGWDTHIGERGVNLSGGQKQRLSMARALLRKSKILIIDDGFSSVDAQTEHHILKCLQRYQQDKTTLLISHKVATTRITDQVMVLEEGKIREIGTHKSLWQQEGIYWAMCKRQSVSPPV